MTIIEEIVKLKEIAVFILNDFEALELNRLIFLNKFKRAQILIDNLLEIKEIDLLVTEENQMLIQEYKLLHDLKVSVENIVVLKNNDEK